MFKRSIILNWGDFLGHSRQHCSKLLCFVASQKWREPDISKSGEELHKMLLCYGFQ